ncbi:MAG: type II toxin-antitoxin system VapC family toxin [Candidatus Aenigmarchaeota archaeon]|nr:type II toxin-antitoxin system VapC family toxin [Candidatus Aenigmarchaeota archaeon]
MIVLDTDALIELERNNAKVIERISKMRKEHPEDISITSAVYAEFSFGLMNLSKEKQDLTVASLNRYRVLDFDRPSASEFAKLKWKLEKEGRVVPIMDLVTASISMRHGATLVTGDAHYERINGLNVIMLNL